VETPRCLGTAGNSINNINQNHNHHHDENHNQMPTRIKGNTRGWQAEAARDLLEIQEERMQVEQSEVGFIIGKGGETIREMQVSLNPKP
jgi:hypothetical protein